MAQLKDVQRWLSEGELRTIYTAEYWNSIEEEKRKEHGEDAQSPGRSGDKGQVWIR